MNTYTAGFSLLVLAFAGYYVAQQWTPPVAPPAPPPLVEKVYVPVTRVVQVPAPASLPPPAPEPHDPNHHTIDELVNDPDARGGQP